MLARPSSAGWKPAGGDTEPAQGSRLQASPEGRKCYNGFCKNAIKEHNSSYSEWVILNSIE